VSKRHQSSRRRSYGRRQHELHERESTRRQGPFAVELEFEADDPSAQPDPFAFLDPRAPRMRFAIGD
jgi:hypothetical protein